MIKVKAQQRKIIKPIIAILIMTTFLFFSSNILMIIANSVPSDLMSFVNSIRPPSNVDSASYKSGRLNAYFVKSSNVSMLFAWISNTGTVYLFKYNGTTWTLNETFTDIPPGGEEPRVLTFIVSNSLVVSISGPTSGTVNTNYTYVAVVSGGTAPYTYSWSIEDGTPSTGNSSSITTRWSNAGTYLITLTVTDSQGKVATANLTVIISAIINSLNVSISGNVSACLNTPVVFTANVSGGTPPYTYSWSGGGTPSTGTGNSFTTQWSTTGSKTISLSVTDSSGNNRTATLNVSVSSPSVSISGPTSGTVNTNYTYTASISGGTPPYTYSWSGGGNPPTGNSASFTTQWSTVGTKTISLTVTDSTGCSSTAQISVNIQSDIVVSISGSSFVCALNNYTYTASVSGGTPPYTYSWSVPDGTPSTGTNSSITTQWSTGGITTVSVTVTDSTGKTASANMSVTVTRVNVSISGPTTVTQNTNYTYTASVSGGTPPYTYSWSTTGGTPSTGTNSSFTTQWSTVGTKTISLTVTDSNGCSGSSSFNVNVSSSSLSVVISGPSFVCKNTDATYTASVSGGTPPYTYSWSGGGNPPTGTNSSFTTRWSNDGTYVISLNVTDSTGKTGSASINVNVSSVSVSITGPTNGVTNTNYTYVANITGGTPPYTYSWSGGGNPSTGTNSSFTTQWNTGGTKTISLTVTDYNGCSSTSSLNVTISSSLSVSISGPSSVCINTNATFTASVTGGTPPYTYSWSNGGTPSTGTNSSFTTRWSSIGTKTLLLTVTDNAGNSRSASINVNVSSVSVSITGPTNGVTNTSYTFTANVSGGTPPYTYSWSGGGTPSTGTNSSFTTQWSSNNVYTVSVNVFDFNGCSASSSISVNISSSNMVVTITGPTDVCINTNASFTANVSGGTSPYTYSWSGGGNPATGSNSSFTTRWSTSGSKTISLTVTDSTGKTGSNTFNVVVNSISVDINVPSNVFANNDATFNAVVSGGTPPYTYSWNANSGNPSTGTGSSLTTKWSSAGTYNVSLTVTDSKNCTASKSISVTVNDDPRNVVVSISGTLSPQTSNDTPYTAILTPDYSAYVTSYSWSVSPANYTITGATSQTAIIKFNLNTTYTITVAVTFNFNGNIFTKTGQKNVTAVPLFSVSLSGMTNPGVFTTQTYTVNIAGGVSPYQISWSLPSSAIYNVSYPSSNQVTFRFQAIGTFNIQVTVQDSSSPTPLSQTKSLSVTVSNITLPITILGQEQLATNAEGTYSLAISAGKLPYTITWSSDGYQRAVACSFTDSTGVTQSVSNGSAVYKWTATGSKTVSANVTDALGNTGTASKTVQVSSSLSLSLTPDMGKKIGVVARSLPYTLTFSASATGGSGSYTFSWTINGSNYTGSSVSYTANNYGTYTATCTVRDNNTGSTVSGSCSYVVLLPVTSSLTSSSYDVFVKTPFTITGTGSGGIGASGQLNMTGSLSGNATIPNSITQQRQITEYTPAQYSYSITVSASYDSLYNNPYNTSTSSIVVNVSQPNLTVTITGPSSAPVNTYCNFSVSVSGGSGNYTYSWSGGGNPPTGTGSSFSTSFSSTGSKTIYCTVLDNTYNTSKTASYNVNITEGLTVTITGPSSTTVGIPVTFDAQVSGGSAPFSYNWSSSGNPGYSSYSSYTTTFNQANTYTVTVRVTDSIGNSVQRSTSIRVDPGNPSTPLTVSISGPTLVGRNTWNTYSASPSGGTPPYTYSWSASGGTISAPTSSSTDIKWSSTGTKTVSVTVTDSTGRTASASMDVTVSTTQF
ncbi:MAG: PKD domain-containing protein [Thermoproteota archaeon]